MIKHNTVKSQFLNQQTNKENKYLELFSVSYDETLSIGRRIAARLLPDSVLALNGKLGSGKTTLAKGIAEGLGIQENLTSPTYTIISEYYSNETPVLYHIDAYRLDGSTDFENIGGVEILASGRICIIEWSERILELLPDNTITVLIEITSPSSRTIKIKGLGKL